MPHLPSFALRDPRDATTVALTLLPAVVIAGPASPVAIGIAVWWLGNTVAHHAVHRRTFRAAWSERAFALWLSLWLGVPQALWRQRHLAHHAGRRWRWRREPALLGQVALLGVAWSAAAVVAPAWLATVYAPGLAFGLGLAFVHGHYEHAGGITDVRARWWNVLLCNDGWHAEHHAAPSRPWWRLPDEPLPGVRVSPLPPPLRWLRALRPAAWLDGAERLVLRWGWLRERVLAAHRRALAGVLAGEPSPREILVVGGGLFPRSAILLRERFPRARITVLDLCAAHLAAAAPLLPAGVVTRVGVLRPGTGVAADLLVLPLALRGSRRAFLAAPPTARILVHDWLWRRPGQGRVVAWWLGKRLYLHTPPARALAASA